MKRYIAFIIGLSFLPSTVFGAIAYPDSGSTTIAAGSASATTLSVSITLSASTNKLVIDVIGRTPIIGCTFNSASSTLITAAGLNYTYNYHSSYYLDNPTTGSAQTLLCSFSGASAFRSVAYIGISGTAAGVGTAPIPAVGVNSNAAITTSITTTAANSDIIETTYSNNDTASLGLGAGQSQLVGIPGVSTWSSIDKRSVTTATAYTVSETPNMTINEDTIVFEIKQGAAVVVDPPPQDLMIIE